MQGKPNDAFRLTRKFAGITLSDGLDAKKYVGQAPQQVDPFIAEMVEPIRRRYKPTG